MSVKPRVTGTSTRGSTAFCSTDITAVFLFITRCNEDQRLRQQFFQVKFIQNFVTNAGLGIGCVLNVVALTRQ